MLRLLFPRYYGGGGDSCSTILVQFNSSDQYLVGFLTGQLLIFSGVNISLLHGLHRPLSTPFPSSRGCTSRTIRGGCECERRLCLLGNVKMFLWL